MKASGYILALLAFLYLSAILGYCFLNNSGHGPNLRDYVFWFFPMLIFGVYLAWARQRVLGIFLALIAGLGIVFTLTADPLRIMMGYEEWIEAGMPTPNSLRIPILLGIFFASLISLAIPLFTQTHAKQDAGGKQL